MGSPSTGDSQVWLIMLADGSSELFGLIVVYVDDMLILLGNDDIYIELLSVFGGVWELSAERRLDTDTPLLFLVIEIELCKSTGDMLSHQKAFTKALLSKHGVDTLFKPLANISIPQPEDDDGPGATTRTCSFCFVFGIRRAAVSFPV